MKKMDETWKFWKSANEATVLRLRWFSQCSQECWYIHQIDNGGQILEDIETCGSGLIPQTRQFQDCLDIRLGCKAIEIVPDRCFFVSLQAIAMVLSCDNSYNNMRLAISLSIASVLLNSPQYLGVSCLSWQYQHPLSCRQCWWLHHRWPDFQTDSPWISRSVHRDCTDSQAPQ